MKRIIMHFLFTIVYALSYAQTEESIYPTIFSDYRNCEAYKENGDYFFDRLIHIYRTYLKNWEICYTTEDGEVMKQHFSIDPTDTIVDGQAYARVTLEDNSIFHHMVKEPIDTLLYRQEGNHIYYLPKAGKEQLLLDYGLRVGDVFVSPHGEKFVVTDTPKADFYQESGNSYWRYDEKAYFCGLRPPRIVRLRSKESDMEDIWIEGVGSLDWGIVPLSVINEKNLFGNLVTKARLFYAPGINMELSRELNEENYKLVFFNPEDIDGDFYESEEKYNAFLNAHPWQYYFVSDTLCITGVKELNCYMAYAECVVTGTSVETNIDQFFPMGELPTCKDLRLVKVRIPGFEEGTYVVNGQTLVCKGADGIEPIQNELVNGKSSNSKFIYDLSGRRIVNPKRGLYIQGGKKKLKR